ncbi:caspase family protein [Bradyrhizobium guangdongense]|uniref:caspase family protein n=1 Tax=Bradyrhizobium guangdongense TaxID=1325090 RepID=UPI001319FA15|nr:caspase family protein [Bradyrhizobium guangdongense]
MGVIRLLVLIISSVWLTCGSAQAEKRVALVIGNSAYKNVPQLPNPANDAALVGDMLRKAGFDFVEIKTDLTAIETRKALREFGGRARDAAVAVIYYAGHGIELDGTNYLIPTDARLETDTDVYDEAFPLDRVLVAVEPAKQLRLIILDACRDNPFANKMKRTLASRGIGRGLAKVEPTSPNTMVAYAAKAGSTASDGNAQNSPFAVALVERLPTPGLDLRKAFGFVRDDVLKTTGYQQEPYVYGSLGGEDVPLVPAKPVATGPQANPDAEIRRDYELALQLGTRDGWTAFLNRFPSGFYADLAKGQLNKISAEETRTAAAEKARQAEEEKARLVAERAKKTDQDKATATAKAAEDARLAAEKVKHVEEAKAAAAEQRRKEIEAAVAKTLADRQATQNKGDAEQKIAALPSPARSPELAQSPQELTQAVQSELRRVGCLANVENGEWGAKSQRSLMLFNKYAGTKLNTSLASSDALDAIKGRSGRVCPLVCDHGFRADGDTCVKIACRVGYHVNDDNECEKVQERRPVAARKNASKRDAERQSTEATPTKPEVKSTGQIYCNNSGCRPVRPGCRLVESGQITANSTTAGKTIEVCN